MGPVRHLAGSLQRGPVSPTAVRPPFNQPYYSHVLRCVPEANFWFNGGFGSQNNAEFLEESYGQPATRSENKLVPNSHFLRREACPDLGRLALPRPLAFFPISNWLSKSADPKTARQYRGTGWEDFNVTGTFMREKVAVIAAACVCPSYFNL